MNPGKVLCVTLTVPIRTAASSARVRENRLPRRPCLLVGSARHPIPYFFGPRDEDSTADYLDGLLASQLERAADPVRARIVEERNRVRAA